MARQTRAQRRARRAEAGPGDGAAAAAASSRARASTNTARPVPARAPEVGERRVPGSGFKNFVAESWAELKKVEWPRQNQLIQGVVVVLVACIVVGVFLYGNDLLWKRFVQDVLLR
jgi:preprotein translocase subunit SecE